MRPAFTRDDSARSVDRSRSSSQGAKRTQSGGLPAVAMASHLNAAVMQQQLGKSTSNVQRGRNWAPSSSGSSEGGKPRAPAGAIVRSNPNPLQTVHDFLFKPFAELLCPMLVPAASDALVREYCEELEKDRSQLAEQNMALERQLEALKLSAAKRQRGKRSKDTLLDRFLDLRVAMSHAKDGGTEEEASVKAAWAAWEKRDRPLKDRFVARAAGGAKLERGLSGAYSDAGSRDSGAASRRGGDDLEGVATRAALVAEWVLALLSTKQAHPESVTLDEVGPLMGLLYAFPRDERVQAAGAECLALIAMDEGDAALLSAEDLVEEGAITVLKEAMRNHRRHAHLQEQAGSALLHMASRSADVAIEIQQAGGTKAITAAIKLHPQLKYLSAYMEELLPPD